MGKQSQGCSKNCLCNLRDDGTACEQPYDVHADQVVPNGTWVMERPMFGSTELIGVTWSEVRDVYIDKRPGRERLLLMADKPFGFIQQASYLYYARQIHKGELGQGVPIPRLKFAREHPDNARKIHSFTRNRDQRRNPFRWARLSDVVAATGISAYSLMAHYGLFARGLHARFGDSHNDISNQKGPHGYLRLDAQSINDRQSAIWIRAGFANTILRLRALNYQPAYMRLSAA